MDRPRDAGPTDAGPGRTGAGRGLLGEDLLGRSLERWASEAAVDEAARARARARWLRVQAEEDASLAGTLVDLAERARAVSLEVRGGRRLRGVVVGLGSDFLALRDERGQQVLVALDAVEVVRTEPGGTDVRGDRTSLLDVSLAGVLGPVAADRPEVLIRTREGTTVRGVLRSAGADVLRVRVEGDPPTPAWVALGAVAVLVLEP